MHKAGKDVSDAREWPMFPLKAGWSFSLAGHMKLVTLKSDFAPVYCTSTPSGKTRPYPRLLWERTGRTRFLTCSNPLR